jgi:N6-L-threonylcarbamoyladenine synthase
VADACRRRGWRAFLPELKFTTDNAAMIAMVGLYHYNRGEFTSLDIAPSAKM